MEPAQETYAFLGGTFDPVHLGHLIVAQDAYEQLKLSKVYFLPALQSPLKKDPPEASFDERIAMIREAIAGDDRFDVLDIEREGAERSYTVHTAERLEERFPDARRLWIIGADQVPLLPRWYEIDQLARRMEFLVLARPGAHGEQPEIDGLRLNPVMGHPFAISSSEVRRRLKARLSVDFFVHPRVVSYILKHGLYVE